MGCVSWAAEGDGMISQFQGAYRFLSNFWFATCMYDGKMYEEIACHKPFCSKFPGRKG